MRHLASVLNIKQTALRLKKITEGSVMLTLELDDSIQAEKLFLLIKLGKLKEQGIVDAKLKEMTSVPSTSTNNPLINLCHLVKSALKKGETKEALEMLDKNLMLIGETFHNAIFVLYSDFSALSKEISLGIRDGDSSRILRNKITFSILNLVDEIREKALIN